MVTELEDGVYPFRATRASGKRLPFTPEKRTAWLEAARQDPARYPMPPCGHESCKGSWWPDMVTEHSWQPSSDDFFEEFEEAPKANAPVGSQYLEFLETGDTGKTKVWDVLSRSRGHRLAVIQWYGPWRQYVMYPDHMTLWNVGCLSDIQSFITARMAERRPVPVPELEHIPPDETRPRMEFEVAHGISYCRRCGSLIAKDDDPEWRTKKPCRLVRVDLR